MPIKLRPSQVVKDRNTGKTTIQHTYAKSMPLAELLEMYTRSNTVPKVRQKVRNELVRRKADIPVLEK
jgi:hypothetical protein